MDDGAVTLKRAEVVPIGAQADVAVGANREECDSFDPQVNWSRPYFMTITSARRRACLPFPFGNG